MRDIVNDGSFQMGDADKWCEIVNWFLHKHKPKHENRTFNE